MSPHLLLNGLEMKQKINTGLQNLISGMIFIMAIKD